MPIANATALCAASPDLAAAAAATTSGAFEYAVNETWREFGSGSQLEANEAGWVAVADGDLTLCHGVVYHAHVYLVDTKGNKRMWHSPPMMVDLTPPPVEELVFPRVYPDRCVCRPSDPTAGADPRPGPRP